MPHPASSASPSTGRVAATEAALRRAVSSGRYAVGARLPSESRLTEELGVSRSVLREAVAALRADGILASRQGAGVFVTRRARDQEPLALLTAAAETVADVIEELELRAAVEIEAAGLAALRASPAQAADIQTRHAAFAAAMRSGEPSEEADYALHLAIARATNNARFEAFLAHLGARTIPRVKLRDAVGGAADPRDADLHEEHRAIVAAVVAGEPPAAREAMRRHLRGGMARARRLVEVI